MSSLSDWVKGLAEEAEGASPELVSQMRRVLSPGFDPLNAEDFIRLAGQGPIYRAGMPPEALSILQWLTKRAADGQDHVSDLPQSVGAILTLVTDRRVEVLEEVSGTLEGTDQHVFVAYGGAADRRLISPITITNPVGEFKDFLAKLCSINGKDEITLVQALNLHYGAVLLYDRDLAAAYTLIVAGIETLSRRFGSPPINWSDWEDSKGWDELASKEKITPDQHQALKDKLMQDRHLRLKETFTEYVTSTLPENFWNKAWEEWIYPANATTGQWERGDWTNRTTMKRYVSKDRNILRAALYLSYNARSGFVHEGKRTVSFVSQIYGLSNQSDSTHPLSFAVLRSILSELITYEVERCAKSFELPGIQIKNE